MRRAACDLLNFVIEAWQECQLMHFIVLTLHSQLPLLVVAADEQLPRLCHNRSCISTTADIFNNDFIRVEALKSRSRRLKAARLALT